jgi:hypothetical protein
MLAQLNIKPAPPFLITITDHIPIAQLNIRNLSAFCLHIKSLQSNRQALKSNWIRYYFCIR